jgi:hypothetical protein
MGSLSSPPTYPRSPPGLDFEVWEGRTVAKRTVLEVHDPGRDSD